MELEAHNTEDISKSKKKRLKEKEKITSNKIPRIANKCPYCSNEISNILMDAHMHLIKCMLQFAGINNTVEKQKLFQTLTAVCFANETSVNMVIDTPPTSPRS